MRREVSCRKMEIVCKYVRSLNAIYATGDATEHSYRGVLTEMLKHFCGKEVSVLSEPKGTDGNFPDYCLRMKNGRSIGHIETKDVKGNLQDGKYKEQFDRYRRAFPNLIITNYLHFEWYKDGDEVGSTKIAELEKESIILLKDNQDRFISLLEDFCAFMGEIENAKQLVKIMVARTKIFSAAIIGMQHQNEDLSAQYNFFKKNLIADLSFDGFADLYAETITYGIFTARLHSKDPSCFSMQEVESLIPVSNPFVKHLFGNIKKIFTGHHTQIVEALVEVFKIADVERLLNVKTKENAIIHFYETFLEEYNPEKKKKPGGMVHTRPSGRIYGTCG